MVPNIVFLLVNYGIYGIYGSKYCWFLFKDEMAIAASIINVTPELRQILVNPIILLHKQMRVF